MNTAGSLFWTNVTKMLKENNKSLRSVAMHMRDGANDKKMLALYDKLDEYLMFSDLYAEE